MMTSTKRGRRTCILGDEEDSFLDWKSNMKSKNFEGIPHFLLISERKSTLNAPLQQASNFKLYFNFSFSYHKEEHIT